MQGFESIQKIGKQNKANGLNPPTAQVHLTSAAGLHSVHVAHGLARLASRSGPHACVLLAARLHGGGVALTMVAFGVAGELGEGAAMEEEGSHCSSP